MELKLTCNCGQKYKFDVEPVNWHMPFAVQCPVCAMDGTAAANSVLAQMGALHPPEPAVAVPGLMRAAPPSVAVAAPPAVARAVAMNMVATSAGAKPVSHNLALGLLGALLGAALGAALMYGFFVFAGFRFPLLGIGIGALTGYGARLLYRGTDMSLGVAAGAIALIAVFGTLYLIFGGFAVLNIISLIVSVSVAYEIAS